MRIKTRINIFARVKSLEKQIKDLEEQVSDYDRRLEALGWRFDERQRGFEEETRRRTSDGRMMTLIREYWNNHILVQIIDDRFVARSKNDRNKTTKIQSLNASDFEHIEPTKEVVESHKSWSFFNDNKPGEIDCSKIGWSKE